MNLLLVAILTPILGAGLCLFFRNSIKAQRFITGLVVHLLLLFSIQILSQTTQGTTFVLHLGGWPVGYAISLIVDTFASLMILLSSLASVATYWFTVLGAMSNADQKRYFFPLFLFLITGVNWAFTTGDLFNLFVSFELILLASYGLIVHGNREGALREGTKYAVINVIAGMMFLAAAGLVYGAFGTLNFAELAIKIRETEQTGLALSLGSALLVVFALKAAAFPLFFWMPRSYPRAPVAILPFFSGMLTKVGVYSLYRVFTLMFPAAEGSWFQPLFLSLGALSMIIGVLGALSQWTFRNILAFHSVSQIGYMIFALGLFTPLGIAAGVFYVLHHSAIKSALFMTGGTVYLSTGSDYLKDNEGLIHRYPFFSVLFFVSALSLAGLPPFSGFYCKYALVLDGLREGHYFLTGVAVLTGLLTLASMIKIWQYSFWGKKDADFDTPKKSIHQVLPAVAGWVAVGIAIALASGPIMAICIEISNQLINPTAYIAAMLGEDQVPRFLIANGGLEQ